MSIKIKTRRIKGIIRDKRKKNTSKMKVDNGGVKKIQGNLRYKKDE